VYDLSIAEKLFFTSGDFVLANMSAASAVLFSREWISDFGFVNPHNLVFEEQWTLDVMSEMSRQAVMDLNGNGEMNWQDDLFGFIGQPDSLLSMLHGAGQFIVSKYIENDLPYINFGSEISITAANVIFDIVHGSGYSFIPQNPAEAMQVFSENRTLFMHTQIGNVPNLRRTEADFGILPMPKLHEGQQWYAHTVHSHAGRALAVPVTVTIWEIEIAGYILELLNAESRTLVVPSYHNALLMRKFDRDEESAVMLDIIFGSRVYDLGCIFNWGEFSDSLASMALNSESSERNIAAVFERSEARIQSAMDRTVMAFLDLQ
jgi:hypothetical protein